MDSSVSEDTSFHLHESTSTDNHITDYTGLNTAETIFWLIVLLLNTWWLYIRRKRKTSCHKQAKSKETLIDEPRSGPYGEENLNKGSLDVHGKENISLKSAGFQPFSNIKLSATGRTGDGCSEDVAQSATTEKLHKDDVQEDWNEGSLFVHNRESFISLKSVGLQSSSNIQLSATGRTGDGCSEDGAQSATTDKLYRDDIQEDSNERSLDERERESFLSNELVGLHSSSNIQFSERERTGDGCSENFTQSASNKKVYDNDISESIPVCLALVKSPTGSSDLDRDETTPKTVEETDDYEIDYNYLNWNIVFRFLTNHLEASKWRLFFIDLYSHLTENGTVNVAVKLEQVENDTKQRPGGCDTVSLLLEQFKAWKQFAGRNAKVTCIYDTLQGLEWNDTLEKFRAYMRKPPMLESNFNTSQNTSPGFQNTIDHFSPGDISLPLTPQIGFFHPPRALQFGTYNCRYEISYDADYRQTNNEGTDIVRHEPDGARSNVCKQSTQGEEHMALKSTENELEINVHQCGETNEIGDIGCNLYEQKPSTFLSSNGKRKGIYFKSYRTRRKTSLKRKTKVQKPQRKKLTKSSFCLLLKTFLQSPSPQLPRDMYQIYVCHLISKLVRETRNKESEILSISCVDLNEPAKVETRREAIVIMYSEKSRVILETSTFEELLFYKDHAREQVVQRLGENIDQVCQKYIFLDYDGNTFLSKETKSDEADETYSEESSDLTVEDESTMSEEEHN